MAKLNEYNILMVFNPCNECNIIATKEYCKMCEKGNQYEILSKSFMDLQNQKFELEQQLKAKDKALDRACEAVSRDSEGRYVESKEELKEMFENDR